MPKIVLSDPSGREKEYEVTGEKLVYGRGEDSDVMLGSRSVARHHMRIWAEDDKVMVEDMTGGKGILLDGEEVSGTFELAPGLEMETGVFIFRVLGGRFETDAEGHILSDEPVPILEGTKGPAKGLEIELQQGDNDVGRDPSLYLVIDEPSISRLHARLAIGVEKHQVIDMRSSNGTFVNKKRVETAELHSGDLVRFGNVEFRFLCGEATSKGAAALKRKKLLMIVGGGVLGLLLIIGVIVKIKGSGQTRTNANVAPVSNEVPLEVRVEQHLKAAKSYMEAFSWKKALEEVNSALELHPISADAKKLESKIKEEIGFKELYDEGTSLYDLSKWTDALALFEKIPEESFYFKKVKYKITEIRKKQSDYHFVEGKSYFRAQQYRKAHRHFIDYMALNPCQKSVYETWIKKTEAKMRRYEIRYKAYTYTCTKEPDAPIDEGLTPEEILRAAYPDEEFFKAMLLYHKGKAELAIPAVRKIKVLSNDQKKIALAKKLEQHFMIIAGKYKSGKGLLTQGDVVMAREQFNMVMSNDEQIMPKGLRSFYRENVGNEMAKKLYKEGLEQFNRSEWLKAYQFWKECHDGAPNDRDCAQGLIRLEELAQTAHRLAAQNIARGNKKRAFEIWKHIMEITRPESLPYKTAKLKLREHE